MKKRWPCRDCGKLSSSCVHRDGRMLSHCTACLRKLRERIDAALPSILFVSPKTFAAITRRSSKR